MTLVPCLYTGHPGELEDPDTGRTTLLVPGETVLDMPEELADTHPHWHRVETAAQTKAREKAEREQAKREKTEQAERDKAAEEAAEAAEEAAEAAATAEQAAQEAEQAAHEGDG